MKKKFKRLTVFALGICAMAAVAILPASAADTINLPYCFYYDHYDSSDTYFGHQFFIEHTGQTFEIGYTEGEIYTDRTVPTNDELYMNLCFYVRYTTTYNYKTTSEKWGYLEGNKDYYLSQDKNPFEFNTARVTSAVRSWASLSIEEAASDSYIMPKGYTSSITGETYAHTIQKTLSEIFADGHDYLND